MTHKQNVTERALQLARRHADARTRFERTSDALDDYGARLSDGARSTLEEDLLRAEREMDETAREIGEMERELTPIIAALGFVAKRRLRPTVLSGVQALATVPA